VHRLLLIRHAKTEPGDVDRVRQLTDRGRRDAAAIGEWLMAQDVAPDLAVVSPATRARQTWDIAAETMPGAPPTQIDHAIYSNNVRDIVAIARGIDESVSSAAIVGHNPSIEEFTARFSGSSYGHVPTGTVVVFDLDGTWADGSIHFVQMQTCRG
jgi:phosphohistidine phosphatase